MATGISLACLWEIAFSLKDREDINLVVANGGDGTVHEVASGLRGSNIPLAIIPAGTGNDVARVHGYSLDDLDKIKVLKQYAQERGLSLSPLVCDYIITHFKRELYYLCNSIKYLDQKSLSLKKKITIPFIKKIIDLKSS